MLRKFCNFGAKYPKMRKVLLYIFLLVSAAATAAPVDQARKLYDEGRYEEALTALQPLLKKSPRDGNLNYLAGASLIALHRDEEAMPYVNKAHERGVAEASLMLARIALDEYRPADARRYYDHYAAQWTKKHKEVPEDVQEEQSVAVMMENMLSRVESIAVIDSLVVDADDFFKAYRLSAEAGSLVDGSMVHLPDVDMAFVPQNHSQILYADADTAGYFRLMSADVLDDGTVDSPRPLPGVDLSGGGNAEFPFLMTDGMTLYFANDGDESIGGYDIFLTRRGDGGNYLQPQNMGMPYNSPFDDYLLAIDETTGLGWWATDRNRIPGKVTIYVFVTADTRTNVAADDPNLVSLAKLSDISLTRKPGTDYPSLPDIADLRTSPTRRGDKASFALPIGSASRIYTSLSDFRTADGRRAMGEAINAKAKAEQIESRLNALREKYRKGNTIVAGDISDLEHQLDAARNDIRRYSNNAILAETAND